MDYRALSGDEVSFLGFGCMRFPEKRGKIDEPESTRLIAAAIAGGVNYFDTAWPYHGGESETFVGRVLSNYERSSYFLATKLPCWIVKSREDAERIFATQLKRLQTGYIDFYLLHALDGARWDEMEKLGIYDLLSSLRASGKIRHLGFSFHDGYPAFERIIRAKSWDFCQIQYNYMDTGEQAGTKGCELAESLGIPVIVMEPLKGGSLATLPDEVLAPFRAVIPGASAAAVSFRWLAGHGGIRLILSGMSSRVQLDENLALFSGMTGLDARELSAVDEVVRAVRSRVRNACTGCSYCMPCPNGVDIPRNFRAWNSWGMYRNPLDARWQWHDAGFAASRADKCVSCGACEPKCPQKIAISADLAKAKAELDGIKRVSKRA
jgi:uncharacterized protein